MDGSVQMNIDQATYFCPARPTSPSLFREVFQAERLDELLRRIQATSVTHTLTTVNDLREYAKRFKEVWTLKDKRSYLAYLGLLYLLEACLDCASTQPYMFENFASAMGDDFVPFLSDAVHPLFDAEARYAYAGLDVLLLMLTLVSFRLDPSLLESFIQASPHFSSYYLYRNSGRVKEMISHTHHKHKITYNKPAGTISVAAHPHFLMPIHHPPRKIIVSNAPPVKLQRSHLLSKERFKCDIQAGGLVSGIKPSLQPEDVWVSFLDPALMGLDQLPHNVASEVVRQSIRFSPHVRASPSVCETGSVANQPENKNLKEFLWEKAENDWMRLQNQLQAFSERHFHINPVVIMKEDHRAFYNGISNGLFWPAFHNLDEYIIDDYKGESKDARLAEDWPHYVNYHFAINTARSCRVQDFIWIHDYHLFLVGHILRSLQPDMECAFFLHIPFRLSDQFMKDYPEQGYAVLRGLLGYKRIGLQTSRDCKTFIGLLKKYLDVQIDQKIHTSFLAYTIYFGDWVTDVGAFPIGIKVQEMQASANKPELVENAKEWRKKVMNGCSPPTEEQRLFLSVERFDYTKGILERLQAIKAYFEKHPERAGKDVFYQVAASSRTEVSAYKLYQSNSLKLSEDILKNWGTKEWKPIIFDMKIHPQTEVIEMYKAADVIVVTPVADGMNLVIKEAIICNHEAILVLSKGAGAESQFSDANLNEHYLTVDDIKNAAAFQDKLFQAATMSKSATARHGQELFRFVSHDDIGNWITSQTDPNWTSGVIPAYVPVGSSSATLISALAQLQERRQLAVEYALKSRYVTEEFNCTVTNVHKVIEHFTDSSGNLKLKNMEKAPVSASRLQHGCELDMEILRCWKDRYVLTNNVDIFQNLSGLSDSAFNYQLGVVGRHIERIGYVDTMVVMYEHVLISPPFVASYTDSQFLGLLQSISTACLLHRFASQRCEQLIIITHIPKEYWPTVFTVDCSATILIETELVACLKADNQKKDSLKKEKESLEKEKIESTAKTSEEEEEELEFSLAGKTVMLLACVDQCPELIKLMQAASKKFDKLPIFSKAPESSKGWFWASECVTSPEVLWTAMLNDCTKAITVTLGY